MDSEHPEPSAGPKKQSQFNTYLNYSGLALQLLVTIGVFGWLGYLLDRYLSLRFPVFMLVFVVVSFSGMLYQIYRSLNR